MCRLRWHGHVECKGNISLVKAYMELAVILETSAESSSGLHMSTEKQFHWQRISCRKVSCSKGRNGGAITNIT